MPNATASAINAGPSQGRARAEFTDAIDIDELARAARARGVKILPGSAFTVSGRAIRATRLGFASMNAAELDKATRRLRQALGDAA